MKIIDQIPFKVDYDKKNYYADFLKWYKFTKRTEWLFLSLFLLISLFLIYINSDLFLVLLLLALFLIGIEVYNFNKEKENIKLAQIKFNPGTGNLIIKLTSMEFTFKNKKDVMFYSQISKVIDFDDVIFFNVKAKGHYPFRLNKSEISSECYKEVIKVMKRNKIKTIVPKR